MTNSNFNLIEHLMKKDGSLDSQIYEMQCELRRDTTIEEENAIIQEMLEDCINRCHDLSCSLVEAYNDIMH